MQHKRMEHVEYTGPIFDCERHPLVPAKAEQKLGEKDIKAIEKALSDGHRIQLKQIRDGTIKIQIVFQKELKI